MTKSELTAVKLAQSLLTLAVRAGLDGGKNREFNQGMEVGYHGAVSLILSDLASGKFSE